METKLQNNKEDAREDLFTTDHLKKGLKDKALKSGGITVLSRIFEHSTQLIGAVILARLLTPEDFGLVAMVTAISGFFLLFKDLGLTDATVQSETINHKQVSTLFWINLWFSIAITILFCLSSPVIAWFYKEPRLLEITIVSSIAFIIAALSTQHIALLRRNMSFMKIAAIEIIGSTGSSIIAIVMALKGASYWALVFRPIVLSVLVACGVWIVCKWRPGRPEYKTGVKPMIKFGANTMGFYIVNYFARNADKALIGWKCGAIPLGFYHKAFHLFIAPVNQLAIPLQNVAVSTLTKLRNEPEKYRRYYIKALALLSFIGMPMCAFIAVSSRDLIEVLLGKQWVKSAEIFAILGWGAGIQILYSTQGWVYVSLGRSDRWFKWGIMASIFTVMCFVIGLPFGPKGVAFAYTISLYILVGPGLWYAGRPISIKITQIVREIWKYYAAALLSSAVCWNFYHLGIIHNIYTRLTMEFIIFTFSYLVFIVVLFKSFEPISQFKAIMIKTLPINIILRKK